MEIVSIYPLATSTFSAVQGVFHLSFRIHGFDLYMEHFAFSLLKHKLVFVVKGETISATISQDGMYLCMFT